MAVGRRLTGTVQALFGFAAGFATGLSLIAVIGAQNAFVRERPHPGAHASTPASRTASARPKPPA